MTDFATWKPQYRARTDQELADALGVTRTQVYRLRAGQRRPSVTLCRLMAAVDRLIELGEEWPKNRSPDNE